MMVRLFFVLAWLFAAASPSVAQSYPVQPIKLIVPYPVGGGTDTMARILAKSVSEILGQQVVVENKAGASGNIGAAYVAQAQGDGYTLLMTLNSLAMNASLYSKLTYNVARDFAPVSLLAYSNYIMVVNPRIPAATLPELIEYAKKNPSKLTYASGGSGGPDHLAMELLKGIAKVDMTHVPYKGSGPGLTDTVAGNVSISIPPTVSVIPFIKSGRVRALAGTSAKRSPALPDVPSIGEFFPGYDVSVWYGILAPKGTPQDIVAKLNGAFRTALASPEISAKFREMGAEVVGTSAAEFEQTIGADLKKWAEVVNRIGLKLD